MSWLSVDDAITLSGLVASKMAGLWPERDAVSVASAGDVVVKRAFNLSRSAGVIPVTTKRVLFVASASCPVVDNTDICADIKADNAGDNVIGFKEETPSVASVSTGAVAGVPKGSAASVALSRLTPALSPILARKAFKSASDKLARLFGRTSIAALDGVRCAEL